MTPSLQRDVGIAFALALAIIIALGASQYRASRRLALENQWVTHTEDVLRELAITRDRQNRATANAESFVITGEASYLQAFAKNSADFTEEIQKLRNLTIDNADQQRDLDSLAPLIDDSIRDLQNEANARTFGTLEKEQAISLQNSVRKSHADVSATLTRMEQEESRLLQLRRDSTERSNHESNALILIGCLSAFLLLGASGTGLYFDISARRRAEESRSKALADLRQSNEQLAKEATRTAEAQRCLQESERSLRELSRHLLRSQDEERRRIGRDMHDSVGQYLSMLMMKLDLLAAPAGSNGASAIQEELRECSKLAEESIREVRTISYLLHPPLLEEIGLKAAVPWYLEGFTKRSDIKTTFDISADFGRLPGEIELALFRILQESLTNIHKHSGSSTADVRLFRKNSEVVLQVIDYGRGIRPSLLAGLDGISEVPLGVGLRGMNERMRQLGGRLDIRATSTGTVVNAIVPEQVCHIANPA